jgi:membrane peptidoglycan carboxypeptidase
MRVRSIGSLLSCAVLAGLTLAAAAFPAAALFGLVAKQGADSYQALPSDLRTPQTPQTTYVYADDGKTLITMFYDQNRHDVPLSDIGTVMQQAMVAAEDTRFYQRGAVDVKGVVRAMVANARGERTTQGASTLSMQYVRNVLKNDPSLTPQQRADATVDTLGRKIQEIRYATALEQKLPKSDILDRYLNIAYFGDGAYGIASASWHYFGKSPNQLALPEAALLAGLVQSPDAYNPVTGNKKAALDRRAYVLDSMVKMGVVTPAEAAAAKASPLTLSLRKTPNDCTAVSSTHNDWGLFCDYFRPWWDSQPQFGNTVADRQQVLREGGYTIVTSLDPHIQAAALANSLKVYGYNSARSLPTAVVQPGTGRVLALAVNRHYSLAPNAGGKHYPNTVDQLVAGGGGINGYQAGSTFKMFTMLAALSAGMPLDTSFNAPANLKTKWRDDGPGNCDGYWCPGNANPSFMDGDRTMWNGFGRSVNTYFVWLEEQVGPKNAVAMAQRLGITFRAKSDAGIAKNGAERWGSFTLGVADTTPLDLAEAYATVAAKGTYCAPLPVTSITDAGGKPVAAANPSCHQAIDPDVAAAANDAARCPVGQQSFFGKCDGGTAEQVDSIMGGRPVAGKTGSSENNSTETFVGFTPQICAAGTAADAANPNDHVGSAVESQVVTAVAKTLATAMEGAPPEDFPQPPDALAFGN